MTQSPFGLNAVPSDLIIDQYDPRYCCEMATMSNTTANPMTLPLGSICSATLPLTAAQVNAGTVAGAVGVLIQETHIPAGTATPVTLITRGPAILNKAKLPAADYAGATIASASISTFLTTNFPTLLLRNEPTNTSEQLT